MRGRGGFELAASALDLLLLGNEPALRVSKVVTVDICRRPFANRTPGDMPAALVPKGVMSMVVMLSPSCVVLCDGVIMGGTCKNIYIGGDIDR